MMQVFVLAVQNAVAPPRDRARRPRSTQFSRSIGATMGVTVMGVIVNHGLPNEIHGGIEGGAVLHRLPFRLRLGLADALHTAFLAAAGVGVVVWVIALVGVKEVPLRSGFEDAPELAAAEVSVTPGPR